MLDAGVPLTSPVAGIAMGLILGEKAGEEPVILTDILGLEDALGTMDFKVAGNATGITAFQLDIKSAGLTLEILSEALVRAKEGRVRILAEMARVLAAPLQLKESVPKILEFTIPPDCIGKVIGPKGKTIQTIRETYVIREINVDDGGSVQIESLSHERNLEAKAFILKLCEETFKSDKRRTERDEEKKVIELGPPPEVGLIYRECEIKSVHNFGVFVEVLTGYEGLVHVSELDVKRVS
jgi:polyribonucleotide nucleotidyltransferase